MFSKKTKSIVSKLNNHYQLTEVFKTILRAVFTFILVISTWCISQEYCCGEFILLRIRYFEWEKIDKFVYYYSKASFKLNYEGEFAALDIGNAAHIILAVIAILTAIRLIGLLLSWRKNERYLRRVLSPIDEMAMAAEKLSHGIDEQRLLDAELAINKVNASGDIVKIGDDDLKGLEASINNLLNRLRRSYEEQSRFVDDASHELRTPIAVIQGYAAMLDRWGKDDPQTRDESIHAILEESEHMQTLVEQLLFLARGDGGRQKLQFENTDASALMQEIRKEYELIDEDHEYSYSGEAAHISADPAMLKQALRILTDNAKKYTPKGGKIKLFVKTEGENVLLGVQDEGIGIGAEEAAHMFERFFRGEAVRGTSPGSGLGLSIAKWIVQHHGGSIDAVGFKDVGTRVAITLKKVQPD